MTYSEHNNLSADSLLAYPRLRLMFAYYDDLRIRLDRPPNRKDLDPVGFYAALPSAALIDVLRAEGRLRFRLVGQDILERIGMIGLGGRWLDQLVNSENGDAVDGLFGNVLAVRKPTLEQGEVQRRITRTVLTYTKLVLPLAPLDDEPETALTGIVFAEPMSRPRRY